MFLYHAITVLIGIVNTRVIHRQTRVPSKPLYILVHWATVDREFPVMDNCVGWQWGHLIGRIRWWTYPKYCNRIVSRCLPFAIGKWYDSLFLRPWDHINCCSVGYSECIKHHNTILLQYFAYVHHLIQLTRWPHCQPTSLSLIGNLDQLLPNGLAHIEAC